MEETLFIECHSPPFKTKKKLNDQLMYSSKYLLEKIQFFCKYLECLSL